MLGLIASVIALIIAYVMSRKLWYAPIIGLLGQVYWAWYVIHIDEYGLLLCTGVLAVIYVIAIPKWYKEKILENGG